MSSVVFSIYICVHPINFVFDKRVCRLWPGYRVTSLQDFWILKDFLNFIATCKKKFGICLFVKLAIFTRSEWTVIILYTFCVRNRIINDPFISQHPVHSGKMRGVFCWLRYDSCYIVVLSTLVAVSCCSVSCPLYHSGSAYLNLTSVMLNLFLETQKIFPFSIIHSTLRWYRYQGFSLGIDKGLLIIHTQYHFCWCPGDKRRLCINSHGIDPGILWYLNFSTREIDWTRQIMMLYFYHWPSINESCPFWTTSNASNEKTVCSHSNLLLDSLGMGLLKLHFFSFLH